MVWAQWVLWFLERGYQKTSHNFGIMANSWKKHWSHFFHHKNFSQMLSLIFFGVFSLEWRLCPCARLSNGAFFEIQHIGGHFDFRFNQPQPTKCQPTNRMSISTNGKKTTNPNLAGWWFQPIWKILVKLETFPTRGENKQYLKPPPSL